MYGEDMRRVLVVCAALLPGCIEWSPSTASSSATAATEDAEETAGAATEASTTEATPLTTTGAPHVPEGLFRCLETELCDRWDCAAGCDGLGPEGMCALSALYDRTFGVIEVVRCEEECALHRLIPRAEGTDDVRWQWRTQTKPPGYGEIQDCMLQPPEFFEACLTNFGPDCADPATWVHNCEPAHEVCFE